MGRWVSVAALIDESRNLSLLDVTSSCVPGLEVRPHQKGKCTLYSGDLGKVANIKTFLRLVIQHQAKFDLKLKTFLAIEAIHAACFAGGKSAFICAFALSLYLFAPRLGFGLTHSSTLFIHY